MLCLHLQIPPLCSCLTWSTHHLSFMPLKQDRDACTPLSTRVRTAMLFNEMLVFKQTVRWLSCMAVAFLCISRHSRGLKPGLVACAREVTWIARFVYIGLLLRVHVILLGTRFLEQNENDAHLNIIVPQSMCLMSTTVRAIPSCLCKFCDWY